MIDVCLNFWHGLRDSKGKGGKSGKSGKSGKGKDASKGKGRSKSSWVAEDFERFGVWRNWVVFGRFWSWFRWFLSHPWLNLLSAAAVFGRFVFRERFQEMLQCSLLWLFGMFGTGLLPFLVAYPYLPELA